MPLPQVHDLMVSPIPGPTKVGICSPQRWCFSERTIFYICTIFYGQYRASRTTDLRHASNIHKLREWLC